MLENFCLPLSTEKSSQVMFFDIAGEDSALVARDWESRAKRVLKAELKRRGMSYADLADKLAEIGVKEERRNISNKIGRGKFSAVFFFQCMAVIGCKTIHLEDE